MKLSLAMVMVQKIAGHEPARKIGDMRVTGKNIIQGFTDNMSLSFEPFELLAGALEGHIIRNFRCDR